MKSHTTDMLGLKANMEKVQSDLTKCSTERRKKTEQLEERNRLS